MNANDLSDTKRVGLYEFAIGQKNQDYYLNKFEDFDDKGPGAHLSWNWAAFVGGGAWALYRKMYGWFFAWWAVATVVTVYAKVPNDQIHQFLAIGIGVFWLGFTTFANSLYHRKIKARIASAQRPSSDASLVSRRLSAGGGVHIWVPIVIGAIPVIGIVAAMTLPAYQDYAKGHTSPIEQTNFNEKSTTSALPQFHGKLGEYQDAVKAKERRDFVRAVNILRPLAKSGNVDAQGELALLLYTGGEGVIQDLNEAAIWFGLAAAQGNVHSQYNLGVLYATGQGVTQDYAEAVKWYRLAAAQGFSGGQHNLGMLYATGQGVTQNYAEAVSLLRLAAAQGHAEAQHNLGVMYHKGQGVTQDYAEAANLWRLAAAQGDAWAQQNLGSMYRLGLGVTQNYARAHMWYNLSAVNGNASAVKNRDIVAGKMTHKQVTQAQKMARECQANKFKSCD